MYENYSTLVAEVRETNSLLEINNDKLEDVVDSLSVISIFVFSLLVFKCSDMLHHLIDACFKGRR